MAFLRHCHEMVNPQIAPLWACTVHSAMECACLSQTQIIQNIKLPKQKRLKS
jgi:hypothetical protein